MLFNQYKGTDLFTHGAWNFLRFQAYILEYFLRTFKREDENRHICLYHCVSQVSHHNYRCQPGGSKTQVTVRSGHRSG